jgi:phosphoglucomutase
LLREYILDSKQENDVLPPRSFVVTTIVSSRLTRTICEHYGVDLFVTLTGFKFIAELIQEYDEDGDRFFQFGFEESFGYLAGTQVRDKDAVVASMLLAEMAAVAADSKETLYDRLESIYERFGYAAEMTLQMTREGKEGLDRITGAMQALRDAIDDDEPLPGIDVKGVRDLQTGRSVDLSPGIAKLPELPPSNVLLYELGGLDFVCVRPSGTEPKIKLYLGFYGPDRLDNERRLEEHRSLLEGHLKRLLDR